MLLSSTEQIDSMVTLCSLIRNLSGYIFNVGMEVEPGFILCLTASYEVKCKPKLTFLLLVYGNVLLPCTHPRLLEFVLYL